MKKLSVIVLLVLLRGMSYGQQKLPLGLDNDTSKFKYTPILLLKFPNNNILKLFGNFHWDMLNPNLIASINIIKNSNSGYGAEGRYGVIQITYKKNMDTTINNPDNITQLLGKYKLNKKSKMLPVYVDSILVIHPENAYVEPDNILSIKVEKEKMSGIKFINIQTTNPKQYIKSVYIPSSNPTSNGKIQIMLRGNS